MKVGVFLFGYFLVYDIICKSMNKKQYPKRKNNRLKCHNYSHSGFYFVTICTKNRQNFFGEISNEKMVLSEIGKIVLRCWKEITRHVSGVSLDEFVIMPNHVHGIVCVDAFVTVGNRHACSLQLQTENQYQKRNVQKLPVTIGSFKSSVTRMTNELYPQNNFSWQKSYYDHVIRNEKATEKIRAYVLYNPLNWYLDIENKNLGRKINKEEREKYYKNIFE
jgi:REP-associated tyrosine transposase